MLIAGIIINNNLLDILLYLGEALLQFVVVFYTNVYQSHSKASKDESISKKLFIALLVFFMPWLLLIIQR
jgi:hypothetical protein